MIMNPEVINVKPNEDYTLHLWFTNGEEGILDMKPYLDKGIFKELRDISMFNSVKPFIGTIQWANEADLCPDTVYLDSKKFDNLLSVPMTVGEPAVAYQKAVSRASENRNLNSVQPCRMTTDELKTEVRQSVEDARNGLGITLEQARVRHPRT
jgi:hypothetical protein